MSVKCVGCRFLTVINPESGERVEATQEFRATGKYKFRDAAARWKEYVPRVVCHAGRQPHMCDFQFKEAVELWRFICKDIERDAFAEYQPGRGPKELDEMESQKAVLTMQEKFLALQQDVFAWRQQQADRDEKLQMQITALQQVHHNETLTVSKSEARGTNWQAVWTAVTAAIGIIALIFGLLGWMKS